MTEKGRGARSSWLRCVDVPCLCHETSPKCGDLMNILKLFNKFLSTESRLQNQSPTSARNLRVSNFLETLQEPSSAGDPGARETSS